MLLAGSSTFYALKKRSSLRYLLERVTRILLPLVFGILLVVPPQVYLERRLRGQFDGSFADFYPHFFDGVYPVANFSWHHLWFLAYLFVYSVAGLLCFRVFQFSTGQKLISELASFFHRRYIGPLMFAIPLIMLHVWLFWSFPQTNALVNDWAWHAQLFSAFVYGYVLVVDARFGATVERRWIEFLLLAVTLTAAVFIFRGIPITQESKSYWYSYAIKGAVYRSASWLWMIAILGVGIRYLNRKFYWLSYASEASHPIYVLHQCAIVFVAYFIVNMHHSVAIKLTYVLVLSVGATMLTYEIARRLSLFRFILGMKLSK